MAVTEIITLQTDASGAVTGITQVTEEMKKLDTATTQTEEATISLKAQIRQMTNELLNMADDDPNRQKLIQQLGELKDRAADAADAVKGNTGPAFESMSNTFGIMTGQLANLDFDGFGKSLTQVGAAIGRVNFKSIKEELGGLIKGIGDMGKALLANPIFLIGATIAGVVAYWDELSAAVSNFNVTQEESIDKMMRSEAVMKEMEEVKIQTAQIELLVRAVNDHSKSEEERKGALVKVNKALEDNGIAAVNDINATEDVINAKNLLIQKLQQEARVRGKLAYLEELYAEQSRLNANKGFTTTVSEANKAGLALLGLEGGFIQSMTDMGNGMFGTTVTELENIQKEIDAISEDIYNDQQAMADLSIKGTKDDEDKKNNIIKKGGEVRRKTRDEILQEEANEMRKAMEEAYEAERVNERNLELLYEDSSLEVADILKARQDQVFKINEEGANKTIELKRVEVKTLQQIEAEAAQQNEDRIKKQRDFRIQQAAEALGVLSDLNDAFTSRNEKVAKKQFAVSKALNMAAAIMNTYGAINKAYNDETMPSTAARIIQATIVGIAGFANVAKIAKTQFNSSTSGGGGNNGGLTGGGGNNTPTAPAVDFGFLQQTGQPGTVETYVLAGNVANALEARQKIIDQSYL
jgi:hypothetical protein